MSDPLSARVPELRAWQLAAVIAGGILLAGAIAVVRAAAGFGIADRVNGDKVRCAEIGGGLVERRYAEEPGWNGQERRAIAYGFW